jgi:nitrile hydratase accessory protein
MTEEPSLADVLDPGDEARPVFDAPWQARAFGLVVALHDDGNGFDWMAFQRRLIDEVDAADSDMAPVDALENAYYEQWLTAFENLLVEEGVLSSEEIEERAVEFAAEERTAEEFVESERAH